MGGKRGKDWRELEGGGAQLVATHCHESKCWQGGKVKKDADEGSVVGSLAGHETFT